MTKHIAYFWCGGEELPFEEMQEITPEQARSAIEMTATRDTVIELYLWDLEIEDDLPVTGLIFKEGKYQHNGLDEPDLCIKSFPKDQLKLLDLDQWQRAFKDFLS